MIEILSEKRGGRVCKIGSFTSVSKTNLLRKSNRNEATLQWQPNETEGLSRTPLAVVRDE